MPKLTQARVKELLTYDPETGIFVWNDWPMLNGKLHPKNGKIAGHKYKYPNGKSYIRIGVDGKVLLAHRLAFIYMEGSAPEEVDHDDGDGTNNKWANLNKSDKVSNAKNHRKQSNNTSGTTGVYFRKSRNKWIANIKVDGKLTHLGSFESKKLAAEARAKAEVEYGYHKNHGTDRPL